MANKGYTWAFAPEKIKDEEPKELKFTGSSKLKKSTPIKKSEDVTIRMVHAYIVTKNDEKRKKLKDDIIDIFSSKKKKRKEDENTNDVFIASRFHAGESQIVNRVHVPGKKEKINTFVKPIFRDLVCSYEDFVSNKITLHTQVYDIDDYEGVLDVLSKVKAGSKSFSTIFPVASSVIGIGANIGENIVKIIDHLDKHEKIIDDSIKLYVSKFNIARNVLQTGHIVCFSKKIQPSKKLKMNSNRRVVLKNGKTEFSDCDYIVYSIRKETSKDPDWIIEQKIATLLSQINGEDKDQTKKHLKNTIGGFVKLQKINRYLELKNMKDLDPDSPEGKRLKTLEADKSIKDLVSKIKK